MITRPRTLVPASLTAILLACADSEAPTDSSKSISSLAISPVVNSLADPGAGGCTPTECTLREALAAVSAGGHITFSVSGTIFLARTSGGLTTTKNVTIDGPATAAGITVHGGGFNFSVLTVPAGRIVVMNRLKITRGGGDFGAGILNRGSLTLTRLRLTSNAADFEGGGIWNGGTLRVRDSTISGNEANDGAGIFNAAAGNFNVGTSTISGNHGLDGVGIENQGRLTLDRSTVSGNIAPGGSGAGLFNRTFGSGVAPALITNSTFSGNRGAAGGGIDVLGGHVTLQNSSVVGNAVESFGGGLSVTTGVLELRNSLVALNTLTDPSAVGPDIAYMGGTLTSRFSLIGTSAGHSLTDGVVGNIVGATAAEVNLGPLAANGGPTLTHALRAGSIAIDAAESVGCPTIDQRGVHRPMGGGCDMGSYEYNSVIAFDGFLPPILNRPSLNPLRPGTAVNLQFRLKGAQGLKVLAPKSPLSQPINCSSKIPTGPDVSTVSPSGTGLSYDAGKNVYTYPWLTRGQWKGSCRVFVLRLIDGTAYRAYFDFR